MAFEQFQRNEWDRDNRQIDQREGIKQQKCVKMLNIVMNMLEFLFIIKNQIYNSLNDFLESTFCVKIFFLYFISLLLFFHFSVVFRLWLLLHLSLFKWIISILFFFALDFTKVNDWLLWFVIIVIMSIFFFSSFSVCSIECTLHDVCMFEHPYFVVFEIRFIDEQRKERKKTKNHRARYFALVMN